jgi:cytidine deaminase
MKKKIIEIQISEYNGIDELTQQDQLLLLTAREMRKSAYAPYSGFQVGTAVLLENGAIVKGNNQENAAFPSGLCAERVALFYAGANYPGIPVKAIAISNFRKRSQIQTIKPCGACCQVLSEYEELADAPIKIILDGPETIEVIEGMDNLLPFRFKKNNLH